jgi:hypothetical protein
MRNSHNILLKISLFTCIFLFDSNPLNINTFAININAQAQVVDLNLVQLREDIRSWANQYRCNGITPIKGNPDGCSKPGGGSGVGDSALFSGLLCYSGEQWACRNIEALKDDQGGLWRSPQRLRDRFGSTGIDRFSQDQMLGILLYLVTQKKYGDPNKARDFANHWGSWMDNHKGPLPLRHFVMCPGGLGDVDACDLEIFYRARIVRHVFDYVGANSPQRGNVITGRYRLGDGSGDGIQGFMNYLGTLCSANHDFHCHLAAVASLILQETGADKRPGVNANFRYNPFSLWINRGRQQNDEIRQLTFNYCSKVNTSFQNGINKKSRFQWMWERPDSEQSDTDQNGQPSEPIWKQSFGWDCIAMINLLKPSSAQPPQPTPRPIDGRWLIDFAANGFGGWDKTFNQYGGSDAHPVPADYDGDGKADLSVKVDDGRWLIDFAANGFGGWDKTFNQYGGSDAHPVPADYDGDGKADLSVKVD